MYFKTWKELEALSPIKNGKWKKKILYEYLVQSCNQRFCKELDCFFKQYEHDENLADLLFDFLLNDEFDGSDSQIGAAYYIAKLDKNILKKKRELVLLAQQNQVEWKRPFHDDAYLEWL